MPVNTIRSYINGQFVEPDSGEWIEVFEPATGNVYAKVADSNRADIDSAVEAAKAAREEWGNASIEHRSTWLKRLAAGLEHHIDKFAKIESKDGGKPITLARQIEIPRSVLNLRFFASLIMGSRESAHDSPAGLNVTLKQPWGVGGTISPWNLPLYLFTWKIAPALAAGNCVVAKPSEITPATAFMLAEVCEEVGFPKGVLNIVQGYGPTAGQAIVEHPEIPAISFTGGTATGRQIATTAAGSFKKVSLELGGKNPNVIFADCDYEKMLATTVRSSFQNSGQICLCGSRILVERSVYDRFVDDFVKRTKALIVGDPAEAATQMGAVTSLAHKQKILAAIEQARADGATVAHGGNECKPSGRCRDGWFVEPTILLDANHDCPINQQEVFGPVVTVQSFDNHTDAVQLANATNYGLSATIWTQNINTATNMAREIQAGVIWVNGWLVRDLRTPFGGMRESGVGREGGWDALDFWMQSKNVCFCS
ncbi:MAG: aldehyde dehydrogenase [Pirellulaceae bacterium]